MSVAKPLHKAYTCLHSSQLLPESSISQLHANNQVQFLIIFILFNLVNVIGKERLITCYVFTSTVAREVE